MNVDFIIALSLCLVGFLYASVGHGGASGYLAILSIFGIPANNYRPFILLLNIIVAGISFSQFFKSGYFKWNLTWPFLLSSIPCAFAGANISVDNQHYNLMLGLALIFPIIKLLGFRPKERETNSKISIIYALIFGACIGFISGILNIGGGIFLSPVIILMAWGNTKEAAASSSIFIVLNSLAGLINNFPTQKPSATLYVWFTAAIIGGILGAILGSKKFAIPTVRYLLTIVLSIASFKLLFF